MSEPTELTFEQPIVNIGQRLVTMRTRKGHFTYLMTATGPIYQRSKSVEIHGCNPRDLGILGTVTMYWAMTAPSDVVTWRVNQYRITQDMGDVANLVAVALIDLDTDQDGIVKASYDEVVAMAKAQQLRAIKILRKIHRRE